MKSEYLGINLETGSHDMELTWHERNALEILEDTDVSNKISRKNFTLRFNDNLAAAGYADQISMRQAQEIIDHFIIDHQKEKILTKAGIKGGYWLSESREEADEYYKSFERRAIRGFRKATRGKKGVMVNMVEQLVFGFDSVSKTQKHALVKPYEQDFAPTAVVTAVLDRMKKDRAKFDQDFQNLGRKFGTVLMPREDFARIQTLSRELAGVLNRVS